MKERLNNIVRSLHGRAPLWLNRIYMPFVSFIRQMQPILLNYFLIEGLERESGDRLRIAYFGRDPKIRNYWVGMMLRDQNNAVSGSTMPVWRIGQFARKNRDDFDFIIVELSSLTRKIIGHHQGFILPRWFNTLIDVENSMDAINNNDTEKHITKHIFSCDERSGEENLRYFFERMFKPYVEIRHRDSSVVVEYSYYLKRFYNRDSRLFYLLKDNKPVAGSFNERKDGMIKFTGLGILDGDREILRMGAIRALYYFMLGFYKETKVKWIDFGGTSPFLSDGLTQFKISMRAIPNKKKLHGEKSIWMIPLSNSNAIQTALKSNPFIYISKKKVLRAIFLESADIKKKKELMKLLKRTRFKEIDGTKIFCWGAAGQISQWIDEEALPDHEVIELNEGNKLDTLQG